MSREAFEKCFPVPKGVEFNEDLNVYQAGVYSEPSVTKVNLMWQAWQAALQSGEPVALTLENAPVGTIARAINGGHWTRTNRGWKWCTGSTFQTPGGDWDGELIPPATYLNTPQPVVPEVRTLVNLSMSDIRELAMVAGLSIVEEVGVYGDEDDDHFTIQDCPTKGVMDDDGTAKHYRYVVTCDGMDHGECQPLGEALLSAGKETV